MFARQRLRELPRFLVAHLLWLAAIVVSLLPSALGQAEVDPWLILASGEKGAINIHTTREDLVRLYGESNVVDQDTDIGDVFLSLEYSQSKQTKPKRPSDFSLNSDSAVMRAQNPHVSEISWVFASKARP